MKTLYYSNDKGIRGYPFHRPFLLLWRHFEVLVNTVPFLPGLWGIFQVAIWVRGHYCCGPSARQTNSTSEEGINGRRWAGGY